MSYYILPKINNLINVNPLDTSNNDLKLYVSHSLFNYYSEITQQIKNICLSDLDFSFNIYNELIKIVNPYEYVFSNVPGSKFSVSKLKPKSNIFYDFLEISFILNIGDAFKSNCIKTLHITPNSVDTVSCFEIIRENFNDEHTCYNDMTDETLKIIGDNKYNFIFFETKTNGLQEYIISLIQILLIILRNQDKEGTSIIKISHIFYKPVLDILYIMSSLYDKVYVLKTNTSNITSFDKFIVCKNYTMNEQKTKQLRFNYFKLIVFLKKLENKNIMSILDYDIPYYFTMKINDINIIVGQQQLETLDSVINILKNKNKDDKIETIKKTNIQKSISWCEKYKIPCNKFTEKTNIFLPLTNEINETSQFNQLNETDNV
jgi:hypothetical protein